MFLGHCRQTGAPVAIKVLNKPGMQKADLELQLFEMDILAACRSPHTVTVIDRFESYRHLYIVQEYIDGITLTDYYF